MLTLSLIITLLFIYRTSLSNNNGGLQDQVSKLSAEHANTSEQLRYENNLADFFLFNPCFGYIFVKGIFVDLHSLRHLYIITEMKHLV